MRLMGALMLVTTALLVAGCQQEKPVVQKKEINLLGDLEMRSTTAVYTTSTSAAGGVLVNNLGMRMVPVGPGAFTMGSPMNEAGRQEDERQHQVRLSKQFHISATEVTQSQWLKVMRTDPWRGQRDVIAGKDQPATHMTYAEAVQFCVLLGRLENMTYRLPTEAEWEYACRAGTQGEYGISGPINEHAWTDANIPQSHAAAVATRKANALGLFDMHGNVSEWCSDWYAPYPREATTDPTGPATGEYRVVRGGAWDSIARFCRSAYRAGTDSNARSASIGLRVVMVK